MLKMKHHVYLLLIVLCLGCVKAQDLKPFDYTPEWLSEIEVLVPKNTVDKMATKRNILVFSLHTGFEHWTIPHTEAVISLLAEKSLGYTVTTTKEILLFEKDSLANYDAVVLNNNCSIGDTRNLFYDKLKEDASLTEQQRKEKAAQLEENLQDYISNGGGLVVLHGAIVMQNKSEAFGKMVGGSFEYHPKQQHINVKLVDTAHPMVKGFEGEGFRHMDEPYFFNNAYFDYDFRPLLYMEVDQLKGLRETPVDRIKYISWIKKYGNGRVFYTSPSHNAQSFENPKLLQFLKNGLLYATGDLKCDDSPSTMEE